MLDAPREHDEVFEAGDGVRVVVDRSTYFMLDDPMRIDYDEAEQAFRLRCDTHVIPQRFRL